MNNPADGRPEDSQDPVSYKSNLSREVRSRLDDFSRTRHAKAEKARIERMAFLQEIRNRVSILRGNVVPAAKESSPDSLLSGLVASESPTGMPVAAISWPAVPEITILPLSEALPVHADMSPVEETVSAPLAAESSAQAIEVPAPSQDIPEPPAPETVMPPETTVEPPLTVSGVAASADIESIPVEPVPEPAAIPGGSGFDEELPFAPDLLSVDIPSSEESPIKVTRPRKARKKKGA